MRIAGPADFGSISQWIHAFHVEQAKQGCVILPTRRSVDFHRDLARDYLAGTRAGVVVVEPEGGCGFVMAGEAGEPHYDTKLGRVAVVWIAWLELALRGQRDPDPAMSMLRYGHPHLVEMGFETASMAVREENLQGIALCRRFGATQTERIFNFRLSPRT